MLSKTNCLQKVFLATNIWPLEVREGPLIFLKNQLAIYIKKMWPKRSGHGHKFGQIFFSFCGGESSLGHFGHIFHLLFLRIKKYRIVYKKKGKKGKVYKVQIINIWPHSSGERSCFCAKIENLPTSQENFLYFVF